MLIIGYRGKVDWRAVRETIRKVTGMKSDDANELTAQINSGHTVKLDEDFVLREQLEELGLLIK
jgi:hypothetical protein